MKMFWSLLPLGSQLSILMDTLEEQISKTPASKAVDEVAPEKDPTPQGLMQRALAPQDYPIHYAVPAPTTDWPAHSSDSPVAVEGINKAAPKFKKWGLSTLIVFALSNVLGIAGLIPVGAIGILISFFMAIMVAVFGMQALVQKSKNKKRGGPRR